MNRSKNHRAFDLHHTNTHDQGTNGSLNTATNAQETAFDWVRSWVDQDSIVYSNRQWLTMTSGRGLSHYLLPGPF